MAAADRPVEFFGKRLRIDIRGIHVNFRRASGAKIAGGYCHRSKTGCTAGLGGVDRVFQKDHRIVAGECPRAAAELHRRRGDRRDRSAGRFHAP
jgi:hypothetical protein